MTPHPSPFVVFLLSKFGHFWPLPLWGDVVYGWPLAYFLSFLEIDTVQFRTGLHCSGTRSSRWSAPHTLLYYRVIWLKLIHQTNNFLLLNDILAYKMYFFRILKGKFDIKHSIELFSWSRDQNIYISEKASKFSIWFFCCCI